MKEVFKLIPVENKIRLVGKKNKQTDTHKLPKQTKKDSRAL